MVEVKDIAGEEVKSVDEILDKIKLLVYGDPGCGKTTLVGSAYEVEVMRPIIILNVEGGMKSIRKKYPRIDTVTVRNEYDKKGRLQKLGWDALYKVYEQLRSGAYPYETVVIDSVSECYQLLMEWIMYHLTQEKEHRDPDIPDKREYGKARSIMHKMMRAYRDLDKHVLMTALRDTHMTDTGTIIKHIPSLPGKLRYEVAGFMDEVVYLYTKTEKDGGKGGETKISRKLLTMEENKYLAKDRSDNLPKVMDDPSMPKIAELVLDNKGAK